MFDVFSMISQSLVNLECGGVCCWHGDGGEQPDACGGVLRRFGMFGEGKACAKRRGSERRRTPKEVAGGEKFGSFFSTSTIEYPIRPAHCIFYCACSAACVFPCVALLLFHSERERERRYTILLLQKSEAAENETTYYYLVAVGGFVVAAAFRLELLRLRFIAYSFAATRSKQKLQQ